MSKENLGNSFYCATSKGRVTRVINGVKMVPERKWVGLSDETYWEMWVESPSDVLRFAHAIEAKLKEKNSD